MSTSKHAELNQNDVLQGFSADWASLAPYRNDPQQDTEAQSSPAAPSGGNYFDSLDAPEERSTSSNDKVHAEKPGERTGLFRFIPTARHRDRVEKLKAEDPKTAHTPIHSILFPAGFIFPPLWFYGVIRPTEDNYGDVHKWRCQLFAMISVIIGVTLLVLELLFRYG